MKSITVETTVNKDVNSVWEKWIKPAHIKKWNFASSDWECPRAENDLKVGGKFVYRMQAKDGSAGFDFSGTYTEIVPHKSISYVIGDGRKVSITFSKEGKSTRVVETFELENENSEELQRGGWQSILDNFKKYTENN